MNPSYLCIRSTARVLLSLRNDRIPTTSTKVAVAVSILAPGSATGFHCDGIFFKSVTSGVRMSCSVASFMTSSPPDEMIEWRAEEAEWQTDGLVSSNSGPSTIRMYEFINLCPYNNIKNCLKIYSWLSLHGGLQGSHHCFWLRQPKHCRPNI